MLWLCPLSFLDVDVDPFQPEPYWLERILRECLCGEWAFRIGGGGGSLGAIPDGVKVEVEVGAERTTGMA